MSTPHEAASAAGARALSFAELSAMVGRELGASAWLQIDQPRIDAFASATLDCQFIHVDPARAAAESPFGGTIAHGFLSLSLLTALTRELMPRLAGTAIGINYGLNRVRFLAPVRAGNRVRACSRLLSAVQRAPDQALMESEVTIEIDGSPKPALVANWLTLVLLRPQPTNRNEDHAP